MTDRPLVMILHNRVAAGAAADEADVLEQADVVAAALARLGYEVRRLAADLDLGTVERELRAAHPDLVFNLVESLGGSGRLIHTVPLLLERLGLPFTGAPANSMFLTTMKTSAKTWLCAHGIATPAWRSTEAEVAAADATVPWIVKSSWEDASLGIEDESVICGGAAAVRRLALCKSRWGGQWFLERFVEGREVNVSLLGTGGAPLALPPAEIRFRNFPPGKPKLVGYRAKWDQSSFEYRNTVREFLDERDEPVLCAELRAVAERCWAIFGLRGYGRVDFRVDRSGWLWVLEVNANPCLSADAGFAAALAQAGVPFDDAVARIIGDSPWVVGDPSRPTACRSIRWSA
jgi:D-alanine-D-alanine ligase